MNPVYKLVEAPLMHERLKELNQELGKMLLALHLAKDQGMAEDMRDQLRTFMVLNGAEFHDCVQEALKELT